MLNARVIDYTVRAQWRELGAVARALSPCFCCCCSKSKLCTQRSSVAAAALIAPQSRAVVQVQSELTQALHDHEVAAARAERQALTDPTAYAPSGHAAPAAGGGGPAQQPRRPFQYGPPPNDPDALDRTSSHFARDDPALSLLGDAPAEPPPSAATPGSAISSSAKRQASDNPFENPSAGNTSGNASMAATAATGPDLIDFDALGSPTAAANAPKPKPSQPAAPRAAGSAQGYKPPSSDPFYTGAAGAGQREPGAAGPAATAGGAVGAGGASGWSVEELPDTHGADSSAAPTTDTHGLESSFQELSTSQKPSAATTEEFSLL
jgi:hypothetical protein